MTMVSFKLKGTENNLTLLTEKISSILNFWRNQETHDGGFKMATIQDKWRKSHII